MEKYLINLLDLNNRVIIPDLGAFILRQKEPQELVFNDLLAFDDGMLTDKLIQEEKLSKAEAQNRIRQFVEKARKVLEKGDPFPLENLGSLRMDANSRIEFTMAESREPDAAAETEPVPEKTTGEIGEEAAEGPVEAGESEAPTEEPVEKTKSAEPPAEPREGVSGETEDKDSGKPEDKGTGMPEDEVTGKPEDEEAGEQKVEEAEKPIKKPPKVKIGPAEGGFTLATGESEVEVDATREDTPLEPDQEEPPFQIDEGGEEASTEEESQAEAPVTDETGEKIPVEDKAAGGENSDPFKSVIAQEPAEESKEEEPDEEPEESAPGEEMTEKKMPEEELPREDVPEPEASGQEDLVTEQEIIERREPQQSLKVDGVPLDMESGERDVTSYTQYYRKKRRAWPWIILTLIIIAILAFGAWFFFPEQVDRLLNRPPSETMMEESSPGSQEGQQQDAEGITEDIETQGTGSEIPDADQETAGAVTEPSGAATETGIQETAGTDRARTETESPAVSGRPAGKQYYVVAGSFSNLRNAEGLVRTLRDQGYDASVFARRNNLHTVCYSSHTTRQAAIAEMNRIRQTHDPDAWVLYY